LSNIDTSNIDQNFPIAGIDNDSQGFRDNYTLIVNQLDTAKSEITALEDASFFETISDSKGSPGDTEGSIRFDNTYSYYCIASYVSPGTADIWVRTLHTDTGTW